MPAFSVAGKRRGKEDDRYLWPEMLRVIQEIRPAWVVGENVAGIVNLAIDQVLSDLEAIGYACQAFVIPVCAVDAPHRRGRVAIVAHAGSAGPQGREQYGPSNQGGQTEEPYRSAGKCGQTVAYTYQQMRHGAVQHGDKAGRRGLADGEWRPAQPGLGGMAHELSRWLDEPVGVPRVATGVKNRVDRLKCLGNAVVPQQFYPIFKCIREIEED